MRRPSSPPTLSGRSDENTGGVKKGPWTPEEDKKLVDCIQKYGHGSWRAVPKLAGLNRCGKSCRLRWTNYLRPDIKRGKFSEEEEQLIIKLHSFLGNKWSAIATRLPGRTDNEIKNHWNTHLRKRLLQMGIDPVTHRPRTDINFIDALANLPQLLAAANNNNNNNVMINPFWDSINTLTLCSDAAQLANELHLLQNFVMLQLQFQSTSQTQFGLLDHLALLNPQGGSTDHFSRLPPVLSCSASVATSSTSQNSEIQIPFTSNETNQAQTINSNVSRNNISNPTFPTLISASPFPEINPSIDWETDKQKCSSHDIPKQMSTATAFEDWRDIKMNDDEAADSYWKDILEQALSP